MKINIDQRIKFVSQHRNPTLLPQAVNLNDPASFRPLAMGAHAALLWPYATMQGWMIKQMPTACSFMKSRQRRYVLLVDRMLYTFKADSPRHIFQEFFELTSNTSVSVADPLAGMLFCIELQRKEDGRTWYLEAANVEDLKLWLDRLKQTVQWLRRQLPGVVTLENLGATTTASAAAAAVVVVVAPPQRLPSATFSVQTNTSRTIKFLPPRTSASLTVRRSSRLPDVLPPQLPPPTSKLPPPPTLMR